MNAKGRSGSPSADPFMSECLRLAKMGMGIVSPNPMVGAVLVRRGKIVARGYHRKYGGPHAEVECLNRTNGDLSDAELYVNLEPCAHHGKTPPCVDRILERRIRRVVVAMTDPNPLVAGRSIRKLRRQGVEVVLGTMEEDARCLNRTFIHFVTTNLPYVHLKVAQSFDGKISTKLGHQEWITSEASRELVHRMRAEYDAVVVGSGTVLADDPKLDVRMVKGRNPAVVILDSDFRVKPSARLFSLDPNRRVLHFARREHIAKYAAKARKLKELGVELIPISAGSANQPSLRKIMMKLAERNIASLLVEGGRSVFSAFVQSKLVNEMSLLIAPKVFGDGISAFLDGGIGTHRPRSVRDFRVERVGTDFHVHGIIVEE